MIKISWETLLKSEMCEGLSLNVDMFWDEGKNVNFLKASNYKLLAKRLEIGAKKGNMKIVDTKLTQYGDKNPDYGFTYLVVLGQSHIVIHTWPEERLMNLDVFTCGEEGSPVKIVHYIRESFKPDDFVVKQNKRGIRSHVKSVDEKLDKPEDLKVKKMSWESILKTPIYPIGHTKEGQQLQFTETQIKRYWERRLPELRDLINGILCGHGQYH